MFTMKFIACILILCMNHHALSQNSTYNDYERLLNDVIKPGSNLVRPLSNQNRAIEVYVTFQFLNLLEINEIQQQIRLNAWINFSWYDEIRKWDPSDYGGIEYLQPNPVDMWRPRVIISNSLGERDVFKDNYAPTAIFSTGASRWYPGTVFSLSCKLDMTYFPFDRQNCSLILMGSYYREAVFLQFSNTAFRAGAYLPNGEWDFVSHRTLHEDLLVGEETFCRLTVSLVFERRPQFYVINILIPVMFMSFLSFIAFIIPKDSGERSSFAITVLLSLAVYMTIVSGQIPPISDTFPIIVDYIFGLLLLSGVSVIGVVIHYIFITDRPKTFSQHNDVRSGNEMSQEEYGNGYTPPRSFQEITRDSFGKSSHYNPVEAKQVTCPNQVGPDPSSTRSLGSVADSKNCDQVEEGEMCQSTVTHRSTIPKDKISCAPCNFLQSVLRIEGILSFLFFVTVWACWTAYYIPELLSNT